MITDKATYAYLCDVYVLPEWRGRGLGTWMMECVMAHPDLQGLRRFSLVTRDAHDLYRPFGFTEIARPGRHMEIARPGIYITRGGHVRPIRVGGLRPGQGGLHWAALLLHLDLHPDPLRRQDPGEEQELAGLGDGDRQWLDPADQPLPEALISRS